MKRNSPRQPNEPATMMQTPQRTTNATLRLLTSHSSFPSLLHPMKRTSTNILTRHLSLPLLFPTTPLLNLHPNHIPHNINFNHFSFPTLPSSLPNWLQNLHLPRRNHSPCTVGSLLIERGAQNRRFGRIHRSPRSDFFTQDRGHVEDGLRWIPVGLVSIRVDGKRGPES